MDSNERNLFSQFERQPYVALTEWGKDLARYTEAHLTSAEEELRHHLGDLPSPAAHETIMNTVMSQLLRAYMEQIEPIVQPGDRIRVRGNIFYDIYTQSSHDFESDLLEQGSELWGRFQDVAVRDYLDEAIMNADTSQLNDEFVGAHIRHFGAHLILGDPIEILPDGSKRDIPDCESVFVPLVYRRLELAGYLSWNE